MGGMTSLLLLLWVGVTVSSVVHLQKRIIGGRNCNNNEHQYHVKLTDFEGNLICGGSLVSNKWILTAAHCWELQMKAVVQRQSTQTKTFTIEGPYTIKAPPEICGKDNKLHDIMLLQLPHAINPVKLVNLPDCHGTTNVKKSLAEGDKVQVAGFASTTFDPTGKKGSKESPTLQCANMEVVPCDEFKKSISRNGDLSEFHNGQHLKCLRAGRVDLCPGDSGGGVVQKINGADYIYGVNSLAAKHVCSGPVVFMDVCEYIGWIKKTIEK